MYVYDDTTYKRRMGSKMTQLSKECRGHSYKDLKIGYKPAQYKGICIITYGDTPIRYRVDIMVKGFRQYKSFPFTNDGLSKAKLWYYIKKNHGEIYP